MFKIVASYENYVPNSYTGISSTEVYQENIATFDTYEQASEYIKKSRLKTPKQESWRSDRYFKKNSLLGNYSYAEIVDMQEELLPHNPEI